MRLRSFHIKNQGAIKYVEATNLSDVVVFAGPNGVGKTTINNAFLQLARACNPNNDLWMEIEATDEDERTRWKKNILNTKIQNDANLLRQTLQRSQRRNRYSSSFLNFDSDRAIRNVQNLNFSWDLGNPFSEDLGWDIGFSQLSNRYNDVRHSLFRLVEGQRREIAEQAIKLKLEGQPAMSLDFSDILAPFKDAFWQLLAPKKMLEVDIKRQDIIYEYNDHQLSINSLSSGEREVVNIAFDFILRGPQDCIILFDEPELHLHPELSYKMLQTLSRIGKRNQFIFSTHSPEIISASLENTVIFVTPAKTDSDNQAIVVHQNDETHHALQELGQSIGVISLGKKIILIEGEEASLDKQTYGAILKNRFPEFILVPVGGKSAIKSFADIKESILNKTIWGVQFYLMCDRDAVNSLGRQAISEDTSNIIKQLPRYHLENYFLDENVLSRAFEHMEPPNSWLRDPQAIKSKIKEIASSVIPYAVALNVNATVRENVGNISLVPKGLNSANSLDELTRLILDRVDSEGQRVSAGLRNTNIQDLIESEHTRLSKSIEQDDVVWREDLPGRPILHKFASAAGIQSGRLKQLYLGAANVDADFSDIVAIFEKFRDGR